MPSLTAMVTNSIGKPPASRTPSLARLASRSSGRLHGVTSFQLDATPTCALSQSASVIPIARSMARAGARSIPSVTSKLRGFSDSAMAKERTGASATGRRLNLVTTLLGTDEGVLAADAGDPPAAELTGAITALHADPALGCWAVVDGHALARRNEHGRWTVRALDLDAPIRAAL